jgi:type II secretory pathway predicted ATPase ExeA
MYEDFFKFDGRPFLPAPQVDRYFPASLIEAARQTLTRCVARAEGAALVIGAPGTGKTLLCQMLAHEFQDSHAIVQLTSGRLATRVALLQSILYQLGLPYRGLNEGELRLSLLDALQPAEGRSGDLLLLCDEAHTLPLRLLEEIRMITNLVRDGKPRVHVVLVGSPVLEERFASPKLSSFAQRLAARCYLEPLNATETAAYVRAQIQAVGGAADLVDETCLRTIHRASDGVPRLINQVCDHALLLASLGGQPRLSAAAIEEAWADLQQLPTPFRAKSGAADVVEFGSLDDGSEELREAIPFRAPGATPLHVACPEDQFDAIENQLREVEQLPEGTRLGGTEVDLDFPEFADVFAEQFDEEEVVLDRFATDIELFADVPRVTSWEGQRLGLKLEPLDAQPQQPAIITPLANFADVVSPSEPPAIILGPMTSFVGPEEIACATVGDSASLFPQIVGPAVIRGDSTAFWIDDAGAPKDQALVLVEEPQPSQPPQSARKREYRQLFAKLRRG